jgi:uroporphyrin-III C-methyltransferase/precorrin-2 dehydrogenase/sirohydrochlorin ferrochelatase
MDYLPVFLDIRDAWCVVIGGGDIAARKTAALRRAGAKVRLVAPHLCPRLETSACCKEIAYTCARYSADQLAGARVVVAATDEREVNAAVAHACRALNIPVNVADDSTLSTFIMPAVIDRSPVVVAISSGGAAPVLSRLLRARLESLLPASLGQIAKLAARFRRAAIHKLPAPAVRRRFWERVFQGPIAELALSGETHQAQRALREAIAQADGQQHDAGEVWLVGAGPGDPELLTLRALRSLQQADVIVYDHLVGEGILDLARRDAHLIYVGKQSNNHTLPQQDINELLVRLAKQGKRVLRLKGGDPFIFGRGGEELEVLARNGVAFQVVPGITAASGMSCYAGIPLTHRDHAQSCVFVTGHLKDGTMSLDWDALARPNQTLVFYMGMAALPEICRQLMRHGLPAHTAAAVVQQATTANQRVVSGSLETLPHLAKAAGMEAPALIVVGEVVRLRRDLEWFVPQLQSSAEVAAYG